MAKVGWLWFAWSRRKTQALEQLAAQIERDACGASTVDATNRLGEAHHAATVLGRLRRAEEALRQSQQTVVAVEGVTPEASDDAAEPEDGPGAEEVGELRSAVMALIGLRDEALLAAQSEHTTAKQVANRFFGRIGEILASDGVLPCETTTTLDPSRQHVVDTRPTDDPALHGKVADVVGPGYTYRGRVIRPEQVVTWRRRPVGASMA